MRTLFIAWQDPVTRSWHPIGRLSNNGTMYRFVYLHGARDAEKKHGFEPLASFPLFEEVYESYELWPLFTNRLLSPSRPDHADFIRYLGLPEKTENPIVILGRSGGRRATDSLEMYPLPERDDNGNYHIHFFVHGLSHFPLASLERIDSLSIGERLLLVQDIQNERDHRAISIRTNDMFDRDRHMIGWYPSYLLDDLLGMLTDDPKKVEVLVEKVNPAPAPLQLRLLCSLTAPWPEGFEPFSTPAYNLLVSEPMTNEMISK